MAFKDVLATWLVEQRWFAGKGHGLSDLTIAANTRIVEGDPELRHLVIAVTHGTATDHYQVLVGFRWHLPDRLRHAQIGQDDEGRTAYDALHDAELTRPLLDGFATDATVEGIALHKIPGAQFQTGLDSLVLSAEQSNTSLVYGDESILKVFRRLALGPNPDLEVSAALADLGSAHIAEPLGWADTRLDGEPTVLAILSRFLRLATDGWTRAATSVRDRYALPAGPDGAVHAEDAGGDFAGESHRLGVATAQVHADLASAFGTEDQPTEVAGELSAQMRRKLDLAVTAVPELGKYADMIGEAYSRLAGLKGPFPVQRVHGDYHLGQVLRTETGWVVLDFEGEPATPLAERRAKSSPLRDVAGMLRSFDYAARHQLVGNPDAAALGVKAGDWARHNSAAFCAGYKEAGGLDPDANEVLLRALVLDKAVYEVLYEARHRPSWLTIPLESLADL